MQLFKIINCKIYVLRNNLQGETIELGHFSADVPLS